MKKSLKTAMTAAMFAASLGTAASTAQASHVAEAETAPDVGALVTATTGMPSTVYGPPDVMESLLTTETTEYGEDLREEGVVTVDTTAEWEITQPSYGPPIPVGDLDYNFVLNAADITVLKRKLLEYGKDGTYFFEYDINDDGRFDKEDIKALRRRLTGKSKEEEDAEEAAMTTTAVSDTETTTTTVGTDWDVPQPEYGPPGWYD